MVEPKVAVLFIWLRSESSWRCEVGTGGGLYHAEHKARPEARPVHRPDARLLLGPVGETPRRHEVLDTGRAVKSSPYCLMLITRQRFKLCGYLNIFERLILS